MPFYRLLLHLYPTTFRHSYGQEMERILSESAARARGLNGVWVWLSAIIDVLLDAPKAHTELLRQDLIYCRRALFRAPAFAVTVIAVTALAVGLTSAVLTVADHVFLRPLPFAEPERLVRLWEEKPGYSRMELSPPNFLDWHAMSTSFAGLAAWHGLAVNLTGMQTPIHVEGSAVTANLFDLLGVSPILGRSLKLEDDQLSAPATMLLSERLWREQFGADPNVIGRVLSLDGRAHIVIGVMPGWLRFPSRVARFWTPMRLAPRDSEDRGNNVLDVIGRLRPGVSVEQARSEMRSVAAHLERAYPIENAKTGATVIGLREQLGSRSRLMILALACGAVCFLLIGCMNVAGLFLARSLERRKELSIRTALGAAPERLVRQIATESLLLATAGGAFGLAVASALLPLLGRLLPSSLPILIPSLDLRAASLTLLLAIGAGLFFGLLPGLRAARVDAIVGLRERSNGSIGGRRQRARAALVIAEVSISVALLVTAGLLIRALRNIQSIDPGFRAEGVLTLRTPLPMPKYERTARRTQFYDQVLSEVRRLPGVKAASYISFLPIVARGGIWPVMIGGRTENRSANHTASLRFVTPGFFDAMTIPLLRGRDVSRTDTLTSPLVAVVSKSFVERYWSGQDPIGRQFQFALANRRVVGVVQDIRVRGLEDESEPQVYLPDAQVPDSALTWYAPKDLVIASTGDAASLSPALRKIIASVDPEQPVTNVQLLSEIVASDTELRALQVRLLGTFAFMALLLAAVGLYGLLSYTVSQRVQEFGLRMALGADAWSVFGLVLRQSVRLAATGLLAGVALAGIAARGLQALLYGTSAADAMTWMSAVLLCVGAALLSSIWPAARAALIQPIQAMRRE